MIVGYLGDIPFVVSRNYLRTFDDYGRNGAGRWARHEIIGNKPVLEFLGPDAEKISFKMQLRADHGISPHEELDNLRKLRDKGKAMPLILGNKVVGQNYWVIESMDETVNFWSRSGQIISAEVSVTLQEYVGGVS